MTTSPPSPPAGSPPARVLVAEDDAEIRQALERSRGALGPAAQLLGVSYKTLQYRIRKYGFDREEFGGKAGEWAG